MNKMEDFINATKLGDIFYKQKKQDRTVACVICIIASLIAIGTVVFCYIKCKKPKFKCMDDLDDTFEDELKDDFFEDDVATE
jgi:hypothetical protein